MRSSKIDVWQPSQGITEQILSINRAICSKEVDIQQGVMKNDEKSCKKLYMELILTMTLIPAEEKGIVSALEIAWRSACVETIY